MYKVYNCLLVSGILLLAGCTSPRVNTSFWRIGTPADSLKEGYTIIYAEGKTRHCYPITEWTDTLDTDTYHALHHHGVAVESDIMAYRIYFDKKQTIDPYCKRTPQLELARSYWYPNDSLLSLGYGDDILRVSGTVGVGSVKYWDGGKHTHIAPVGARSQRIVCQDKHSATIEMAVKQWHINAKDVDMRVQYTMHAHSRDMRCDVYLSDTVSGLCTGVQLIPFDPNIPKGTMDSITIVLPNGVLLGSWGTDWPVNDTLNYSKETVGLGVFIPRKYAGSCVHDSRNVLCLLEGTNPHFYLTCVGASKENHPVARNAAEWYAYLRRWARHLQ